MPLPTTQTDRLLIREYAPADVDNRHRLMREAFQSDDTLDDTRRWLDWSIASHRELARLYQPPYGDYAVALKTTGEVIGSVGIVPLVIPWDVLNSDVPDDHPARYLVSPEFGLFWAVLPDHWGKGYAPEAARAVVNFLFETMSVKRVVATTEHDNTSSQRVMTKLGMTLHRNPGTHPHWFQVVGVLDHPALAGEP